MRKIVLVTVAAALALPALPAQAGNGAQGNAARDAAAPSARGRDDRAGERRICVREALGGSRITRPICKTAREWEEQGGLERDR